MTAVIPVFNGCELLRRLLDSMFAQTIRFEQIIVVDNGSSDGVAGVARERGCTVLAMGFNSGFARAVNRGWQEAQTEWIAILNSDVELASDWLEKCLLQAKGAAFVTGKILQRRVDKAGRSCLDGTYDLMSRAGCAWRAGYGNPDSPGEETSPVPVRMIPATACLFRRDVLSGLNGFDESFDSYLEDVDLGLRCIRAAYAGVYAPAARAVHVGSATFGAWNPRVVRRISRNQLLLIGRHYDRDLLRAWLWPVIAGQLLWGLLALRHGSAWAWCQGKFEGLRAFRKCRDNLSASYCSREVQQFIETAEAEIRERARDPYWHWYFRLTAGAAL